MLLTSVSAEELKLGLKSKWGIAKITYAREYRRAATHVLRFIKSLTDGAQVPWDLQISWGGDATALGRPSIQLGIADPSTDPTLTRVINIARSLYRCYLSCRYAFPTANKRAEWAGTVWCEASIKTGSYLGPSFQAEWFAVSSMDFLDDMRMTVRQAVDTSYGFHASSKNIRDNTARATQLLSNNAFIYREHNSDENLQYPYQHPIIQEAINILWFKNKDDDGMTFQEHFSPMPIPAMALVLAVIQCCIEEWTNGTGAESDWNESRFKSVYQWHIDSLIGFDSCDDAESGDPFEVIRSNLLHNASCHADLADTRMAQPEDGRNYVVVLNNFLQGHPTGNLTPFLQYVMSQEGRGDTLIHTAIAKFRHVEYAVTVGRGTSKGSAKRDAAKKVYEYFLENGVPGPHEEEPKLQAFVISTDRKSVV